MSDRSAATPASLRVLLVDDESPARLRLASLVAECPLPRAEVAGEAANATQALVWLAAHRCDVVLADIAMPGRDGLQLAAEVSRLPDPPAVVFVTAHAGHALAAFELAAVDYLTKPVRRERLHGALQRVAARQLAPVALAVDGRAHGDEGGGAARFSAASLAHAPGGEPVLVVHQAGRVLRVPVSEVLYLKAELKYVTLRTASAAYLLDEALADLAQRLGDRFLRVHRNALVARSAIRAVERRPEADPRAERGAPSAMGRTVGSNGPHERGDAARALSRRAASADPEAGWAVLVHPVGERLAVSRRQAAAVRAAMRECPRS